MARSACLAAGVGASAFSSAEYPSGLPSPCWDHHTSGSAVAALTAAVSSGVRAAAAFRTRSITTCQPVGTPAAVETPEPMSSEYTPGLAWTLVASATLGSRAVPGGVTKGTEVEGSEAAPL